ncbi:replication initiation protein [Clostridium estertheticum]|uniref:replication initiation protein n=1 Tax=Clostridium estertheticum TaxID=238834 RepID=UPI001CF16A8C|nr:replication initiation protein [Clostridium estertheticum]MCB2309260.1 replication initiation protein [Clostridium estertheticum]MCB2346793.1 replication initiation protein [Clostridium estertheticum]MCB2352229.1 replication initiation protein [Clostridium estertheticum]WAG48566.1 replication initiation protein [Clostridium estertheticum]
MNNNVILTNNTNLLVKSNYIIEASYRLGLQEQKIISLLTSKISKEDSEFTPYKFTRLEISNILINHKINLKELNKYITNLRNAELVIFKEDSTLYTKWLSSAEYFKNGNIELCFDSKLKPYLLQLKEKFSKIYLDQIVSFNSIYSIRIYELLKQYEKVGSRLITVEKLRSILSINSTIYKRYADFKKQVITNTKIEINKKTDISFEVEEIKTGRKVTSLKFYIKSNDKVQKCTPVFSTSEDEVSATLIESEEESPIKKIMDIMHDSKITALEARFILDTAKGDLNIFKEKYAIAKKVPKIKNIVGWVIKAIKDDYQAPKGKENVGSFNDYEQREYDFDELERKLLGWDNL